MDAVALGMLACRHAESLRRKLLIFVCAKCARPDAVASGIVRARGARCAAMEAKAGTLKSPTRSLCCGGRP